MPNCDFYAANRDHLKILTFLFESGDCDLYQSQCKPFKTIDRLKCIQDVESSFEFTDWRCIPQTMYLQIYAHGAGGSVQIEPVAQNTPYAAFRTSGWGLIQLYLEAPRGNFLGSSHTNHFSEGRAQTWSNTVQDMESPDAWDWARINSFSGRLNRFIRKLGVDKVGSRAILEHAAKLRESGIVFQG